jgi:2-polyprenyl-3-methyl-5-hydroxy-6-metoxy-1,4-benzoquinol methylase
MLHDLAGQELWDSVWEQAPLPKATDPRSHHRNNTVEWRLHEYFERAFANIETRAKTLLEVGAARSAWLPYFAKEFGFTICGLDYSELGCQQAEQILANEGVVGTLICADLFNPPASLLGAFDVVVSFGVVEHFSDTVHCIEALAKFLKPGGLLITEIPNLVGLVGRLMAFINRPFYDIHVLIDCHHLKSFHEAAGLQIIECKYFMFTNFGVANMHKVNSQAKDYPFKKILWVYLQRLSKMIWIIERSIGQFPANRLTSPYILCTARLP